MATKRTGKAAGTGADEEKATKRGSSARSRSKEAEGRAPTTAEGSGAARRAAAGSGAGSDGEGAREGAATSSARRRAPAKAAEAGASEAAAGRKAAKGNGGTGTQAAGGARRSTAKKPDLKKDLRDFASARPQGWGHEDWISFLEDLQARGHNVNDREEVGRLLERERLDLLLSRVKGLGPQKRKALVERFETAWSFRHASVDDIAQAGDLSPDVAERAKSETQG